MKKSIILALILACNFAFFIPKSSAYTAEEIYNLCNTDGVSIEIAEEQGKLDELFVKMNDLFIYTDATDEKYSAKELKKFYEIGLAHADDFDMNYVHLGIGAGWNMTYTDMICNSLYNQDLSDYANNIVLSAYDADLYYSENARLEEHSDSVNIGFWLTNTPVIFPVYIDKSGDYEMSVLYSKQANNGSRAPLEIYVLEEMPEEFLVEMLDEVNYFSIDLPVTGSWGTYVEKTLAMVNLYKNNTYFIIFRDRDTDPNRGTMNLRELSLKIVDEF